MTEPIILPSPTSSIQRYLDEADTLLDGDPVALQAAAHPHVAIRVASVRAQQAIAEALLILIDVCQTDIAGTLHEIKETM